MLRGIYSIRHKESGRFYIGSTNDFQRRRQEHFNALRKGKHHSAYLQKVFDKYGEDSLEMKILEKVKEEYDSLLKIEQYYIDNLEPEFNVSKIATGGGNNQIPVAQFTLDHVFIAKFDSIKLANLALNREWDEDGIGACLRGDQKTAYGFKWIGIENENESSFLLQKRLDERFEDSIKIQSVHPTTGWVTEYRTQAEAARDIKRDPASIREAILRKDRKCAGLFWRRVDEDTIPHLYVGIDVGKTGAIVMLDDNGTIFGINLPLIGRDYDKKAMVDYIRPHLPFVKFLAIEDVTATQMGGKVSNFDFGRGKGLVEGLAAFLGIRHELVKPKAWQKEVWTAQKIMKPGAKKPTVDTKATSLKTAQMLWPDQEWNNISEKTGAVLSTVNDGLVDAALIAEYCRRKFK